MTLWIEALGQTLIHSLWQGCLIWLAAALTMRATHRSSARYQIAASSLSAFALIVAWTFLSALGTEVNGFPIALVEFEGNRQSLLQWVVWAWLAGVACFAVRLICGLLLIHRHPHRLLGKAWQNRIANLAARMNFRRTVRIAVSPRNHGPMVIGVLVPVIVLPIGLLSQLSRAELEAVLLHELGHVVRYDVLVGLLQSALEALFFYHPAVWWLSGQMRAHREHCCDDLAVAVTGRPRVLARALVRLGESSLRQPAMVPAATGGPLMTRVRHLMEGPIDRGFDRFSLIPAVFLVISLVLGSLAIYSPAPVTDSVPEHRAVEEELVLVEAVRIREEQERRASERLVMRERARLIEEEKNRTRREQELVRERLRAVERQLARVRAQEAEMAEARRLLAEKALVVRREAQ